MWRISASVISGLSCAYFLLVSCGSKNIGDDTREITSEEEAKELMNDGDFQGAIDILAPLVKDEPKVYARRPLLSAAYAAKAGIKIFDIVESQIGAALTASDSVFDEVDGFLPKDYDKSDVKIMNKSVLTLEAIPRKLRGDEGDPDYGASADFQLTLYRGLYSTMYLYLFMPGGEIDLDNLENLTDEDVEAILRALSNAASEGDTEQSQAIAEAIDGTLSGIDDAEGDTDRERLINYLNN